MTVIAIVKTPNSLGLLADSLVTPSRAFLPHRTRRFIQEPHRMVSKIQNLGDTVLAFAGEVPLIVDAAKNLKMAHEVNRTLLTSDFVDLQRQNICFGTDIEKLSILGLSISSKGVLPFGSFFGARNSIEGIDICSAGSGFLEFFNLLVEPVVDNMVYLPEDAIPEMDLVALTSLLNWRIIYNSDYLKMSNWGGLVDIWSPDTPSEEFAPLNNSLYGFMFLHKGEGGQPTLSLVSLVLSLYSPPAKVICEGFYKPDGTFRFESSFLPTVDIAVGDSIDLNENEIQEKLFELKPDYARFGIFGRRAEVRGVGHISRLPKSACRLPHTIAPRV